MPVYTVHAPEASGTDLAPTDRFVFVRDGFRVWATVPGVLWLAWQRLWLAPIGWIVLMAAIDFAMVDDRCQVRSSLSARHCTCGAAAGL